MSSVEQLNILIIEDNLGDFLLIRDYLEEQVKHLHINHCKRFSEAEVFLIEKEHSFDVILLDLTLPDKTGMELIADVVGYRPDVPVIILTGYADLDFSVKSLSMKVSDYLLKDDINSSSLYKSIMYNIERKKTQLLLEESEKRYSSLFQLSPQPMWIVEINNFNFVQVNRAAIKHYGYDENEFLQLNLFDIEIDSFQYSEKRQRASQVAQDKSIYKGRYQHKKKSGEIIEVDIYSTLININNINYESAIAIDVTEKIKMEHLLTKAIIKTQEDERFEIGTELHDNVCQILASSLISLDMIEGHLHPETEQWHAKSKKFINLALEEIRNISHRLAPSFFGEPSLENTFRELLNNFNIESKYKITFTFNLSYIIDRLNNELQLNLYRILQEQLRNISKYAQAQKVNVKVSTTKNELLLSIEDDGIGFNPDQVVNGIGLANIRRRTELFGGALNIESSPGNGCLLTVRIPLNS